ncbi:HAMP domain-containing histidine kinase [candidate division WOR-3 bacterium]|nr:HAMP domain-containing histidine kinase [candidate division WOR-3 bacterium]
MHRIKKIIQSSMRSLGNFNLFDLRHPWLKFVLFVTLLTISGVGILSYVMTQKVINDIKKSEEVVAQGYASLMTFFTTQVAQDPSNEKIFLEGKRIIASIPIPVVITEPDGKPRAWRNIGIYPDAVSSEELDTTDIFATDNPVILEIVEIYEKMDKINEPIPIYVEVGEIRLTAAYLHYGNPPFLKTINLLPLIQTGLLIALLFTLLISLRIARNWERDNVWMIMAKETAHQLATPFSSIMGWIEFFRADPSTLEEGLDSIQRDLLRMNNIIKRFSRIGTSPTMMSINLDEIVRNSVEYFSKRLPTLGHNVNLTYDPVGNCPVTGDAELLSWVIENIIKNSLDAMNKDTGEISISLGTDDKKRKAVLRISDNGKGMTKKQSAKVFDLGYTSKKYGWGMGLTLSKRIIETMHEGRIYVESSKPDYGTVFAVELKLSS